jgi:hypothetical protein
VTSRTSGGRQDVAVIVSGSLDEVAVGRSLDRPNILNHWRIVASVVTAPQLSAVQASHPGFGSTKARSMTTPLYDALVHEYRLALRCVPGDQETDDRIAGAGLGVGVGVSGHPDVEFGALPRPRRASGVPRQVSRHRGASDDSPGQAYY